MATKPHVTDCTENKLGYEMTEQRDLLQERIDRERQYAKEVLDLQFKGVGYLFAANAAGLAGCITLLKD
jgi:hypothetical protein